MPIVKPAELPRWEEASGDQGVPGGVEIDPASGVKDVGWTVAEKPPAQYMNWWMRLVYDWVQWLNDLTNQALTWVALHTFQKGISVTQSTTNSDAIDATGNGTGAGISGSGGTTNAPGVRGTGGGTGPGLKGTGGSTGAGGPGVSGTGAGSGDQAGGFFTGGATNGPGVTGSGDGSGAGVVGGGGATGPGLSATAGGGGTPARGALELITQAAPSSPSNGDVWYNGTRHMAKANGVVMGLDNLPSAVSSSSAGASTTSATLVDIPNLSVPITTTGRPVILALIPDGATPAYIEWQSNNNAEIHLFRGGSDIAQWILTSTTAINTVLPASPFFIDAPAAGSYTYKFQYKADGTHSLSVAQWKLVAYEI